MNGIRNQRHSSGPGASLPDDGCHGEDVFHGAIGIHHKSLLETCVKKAIPFVGNVLGV